MDGMQALRIWKSGVKREIWVGVGGGVYLVVR